MNNHQFSISQLKTARACLRKWWLKYIIKATPDYTEDSKALIFGRLYHKAIETGEFSTDQLISNAESLAAYKLAQRTTQTLRDLKYTNMKSEIYFSAFFHGYEFRGYIDAIGKINDDTVFAEFKTTGVLLNSDRIIYDIQILFYNYFSGVEASAIIYHQAVKPLIRQNKNESDDDFAQRFLEKSEEKIEIIDTNKLASRKECEEQLYELLYPCAEILRYNREPKAIYTGVCQNFGKPCEFWSYCFGQNRQNISCKNDTTQQTTTTNPTIEIEF